MNPLDRFSATVAYDPESSGYIAVCEEIPGISAFGATRAEALSEFEIVLDMALDTYREEGWPLPQPRCPSDPELPSGEFRVRIPRYLHGLLAKRAADEGVSQNTLVVAFCAQGLAAQTQPSTPVRTTAAATVAPASVVRGHAAPRPRNADLTIEPERAVSPYASRSPCTAMEPAARAFVN